MSENLKLGHLITSEQQRDAVHIAVVPVEAAHHLEPGQKVTVKDGKAYRAKEAGIGVIDPFLALKVMAGEKCWLYLYPGSITSLRHEWTHPAFGASASLSAKSLSERWMRAWAMKHVSEDCYGDGPGKTEDEALAYAIEVGHNTNLGPYESAQGYIDNEWWTHWEAITGTTGERGAYFSCAC
jgi:hypothetical protein